MDLPWTSLPTTITQGDAVCRQGIGTGSAVSSIKLASWMVLVLMTRLLCAIWNVIRDCGVVEAEPKPDLSEGDPRSKLCRQRVSI